MAAAGTDEAKELSLVGKLELRIALADSESKLQTLLSTFLCPLLLKLASPSKGVRDKVIAVCQHVNTRLKTNSIKLPVADLLQQFKQNSNSLIRHFDLIYIQQGLPLLPKSERAELFPIVLVGLEANFKESSQNAATLFNLLLRLLPDLSLPPRGSKDDLALRSKWGLEDSPQDAKFAAHWIGKLLLFGGSSSAKNGPGLSTEDWSFLSLYGKPTIWDPSAGGLRLVETKVLAAKFLASGAFTTDECLVPGLAASADGQSRVAQAGEEILKRTSPASSLESSSLIEPLFQLYFGQRDTTNQPAAQAPLRLKILGLLSRSKLATTYNERIVQMVKEILIVDGDVPNLVAASKGREGSKIRREVFVFINWVARMASAATLKEVAAPLIGDLRSYVEGQGWPKATEEVVSKQSAELSSRNYAYETIGLLAKTTPAEALIEPDLDLLRWLFLSLIGDTSSQESTLAIESALSTVLPVFADADLGSVEEPLAELLMYFSRLKVGDSSYGTEVARSARYSALRFANRCLPFSAARARYMNALALASGPTERHEIVDEAKKGLNPFWYRKNNPPVMDAETSEKTNPYDQPRYQMPNPIELISYCSGAEAQAELGPAASIWMIFSRSILFHNALSEQDLSPDIDEEWQRKLDALVTNDTSARKCIHEHLTSQEPTHLQSMLAAMTRSAVSGLTAEGLGDAPTHGQILLEICVLGPTELIKDVVDHRGSLLRASFSNKPEVRSYSSFVNGIALASELTTQASREEFARECLKNARLWNDAVGSDVYKVEGSILNLGYFFSRLKKVDVTENLRQVARESLSQLLAILFKCRDKAVVNVSLRALDRWFIFDTVQMDDLTSDHSAREIIEKLGELAKPGNEEAVSCLGHLTFLCPDDLSDQSPLQQIQDALIKLHEVRQPELHFTVGAALACLAASRSSTSLTNILDFDRETYSSASREELPGAVLDHVLENCKQTKPALRQASVIWLLCLVQFCGHLPQLQKALRSIQKAFMGFLSDRDSLNQETASRGLGLVYEKGDRDLKDDLVHDLVGSFTSTSSNLAGTVHEDTELFEPGALPTGDGSVTTYKDIVNLASEVGDPSLVYRFMSLASNNSIWSSRAAFGRFGLSKVLSDSSVEGYLSNNPKLYPVLFRYRFDPNSNVRTAMNEIWSTLVKDPKSVIDNHFEKIVEELFKNSFGREWRTREACCAALGDLVQGRPLSSYDQYLTQIWNVGFKLCDDIKGSVRKAAMALVRILSGILIRSLEAGDASSSTTDEMLQQVIPFLSGGSGLDSSADDVRAFALITLMDIVKKGNQKSLRPYLGSLVARDLLPSLSSMEPAQLNYLYQHLKDDSQKQTVDDARLSSVKMSPMMDTIERCLDLLDEDSMKDLSKKLGNAMKSALGLPFNVGICRVLVSLSTRQNLLFRPHAAPFLKSIRKQIMDRNDTVSTSAAAAGGYLCRIVDTNSILTYIEYAKSLYFNAEDEKHRTISGEIIANVIKHATDRAQGIASSIAPFVFFGTHDTHDQTNETFRSAWDDLSGGSRAVLLYLSEIMELVSSNLDSSKWPIRHAAAFTIADVVKSMGTNISETHMRTIWPMIEQALQGKTWEGKEKVLERFVQLVSNSSAARTDAAIVESAKKIMVREAKRRNAGVYRQQAVKYLGSFTAAFTAQDWFDEVLQIVTSVMESLDEEQEDMDVDSKSSLHPSSHTIGEQTRANACSTLLKAIRPTLYTQTRMDNVMTESLKIIEKVMRFKDGITQNALFSAEKELFQEIIEAKKVDIKEAFLQDYMKAFESIETSLESTRIKAADTAETMRPLCLASETANKQFRGIIESWLQAERSPQVRQILQRIERGLHS